MVNDNLCLNKNLNRNLNNSNNLNKSLKYYVDTENSNELLGLLYTNNNDILCNHVDNNGNSVLSYSVVCNKNDMVYLILDYITNKVSCPIKKNKILNHLNNDGNSVLFLAVKKNDFELAKQLYNCGVSDKHVNKMKERVRVNKDCGNTNNRLNNFNMNNDMVYNFNMDKMMDDRYNMDTETNTDNMDNVNNMNNQKDLNTNLNFNFKNDFFDLNIKKNLNTSEEKYINNLNEQLSKNDDVFKIFNGGTGDTESVLSIGFNRYDINENVNMNGGTKSYKRKKVSKSNVKKGSTENHEKTIKNIMNLGYDVDDAKIIKAGLYMMVKEKYPDLNNMTRSEQLLKMVTKDNISKLNLNKIKKLIDENRKNKDNGKDDNKDDKKKKKSSKRNLSKNRY